MDASAEGDPPKRKKRETNETNTQNNRRGLETKPDIIHKWFEKTSEKSVH